MRVYINSACPVTITWPCSSMHPPEMSLAILGHVAEGLDNLRHKPGGIIYRSGRHKHLQNTHLSSTGVHFFLRVSQHSLKTCVADERDSNIRFSKSVFFLLKLVVPSPLIHTLKYFHNLLRFHWAYKKKSACINHRDFWISKISVFWNTAIKFCIKKFKIPILKTV